MLSAMLQSLIVGSSSAWPWQWTLSSSRSGTPLASCLPLPPSGYPSPRLHPSLLLLFLALLTATTNDDSATWQLLVGAQVHSPFKGQGIAPTVTVDAHGNVVYKPRKDRRKDLRVPVYMSILFDKLEDVDGE